MGFLNKGMGPKQRWLYPVFGAAIGLFIVYSNIYSMFYPHLQVQFGIDTVATFALGASLMGAGDMLAGPIFSWAFFDKYGPKVMYIGSAICLAIGLFCMRALGAGTDWNTCMWFWYGGSFILGLAAGLRSGTAPSICAKWIPDNVGFATGIVAMGQGLAAFWMAPVATFLLANMGWTDTFTILISIGIVVVILLGILPQKLPNPSWKPEGWTPPVDDERSDDGSLPLSKAIRTREYWVLWACIFLTGFANFAFVMNVVPIYIEGLGAAGMDPAYVTANVTAVMLSITAVINCLGRPVWGFIRDRIKDTWVTLKVLYIGVIAALVIVSIFYTQGVVPAIAAGCLVYFFCSGTSPVHMSAGPALFGPRYAGAILSTTLFATGFAWVLGPYIGATVKDLTGQYVGCFYLAIALCVIALILLFWLSAAQKKEKDPIIGE